MVKYDTDYINIVNHLRTILPFYGYSSGAIELLFFKQASELLVNISNDIKLLNDYKNMFINHKFDFHTTKKTFEKISQVYNMNRTFTTDAMNDLTKIFEKNGKLVFTILNDLVLPNNSREMCELIENIFNFGDSKDVSRTESSITNTSLVNLVKKILDVKEDEIFIDSFAGLGRTLLSINAKESYGYEINSLTTTIANMVMILSNKHNCKIKNKNFFLSDDEVKADKIFSDGAISGNVSNEEYMLLKEENRRVEYFNITKTLEKLSEKGKAVITCGHTTLLNSSFKKLRKSVTLNNLIAVIALPPLWRNTLVNTNLLVLGKQSNKDIVMIDASSKDFFERNDKRTISLKTDGIEKILEALNGKTMHGFSSVIKKEEILNSGEVSWVPSHYIKSYSKANFRPSNIVLEELEKTYKELENTLANKK